MKNKGFTLIEVLGVVILIALLLLIVFPSIINFIKKSSDEKDRLTKELIFSAADSYIKDHINDFPKMKNAKYEIELKDLVDEGLLISPIKYSDSDDITNDKCVQVTYSESLGKYSYDVKDECNSSCVLTQNKKKHEFTNDKGEIKNYYDEYGYYAIVGDVVTCGTEQFYVIGIQDSEGKINIPTKAKTGKYPILKTEMEQKNDEDKYVNKLAMISKYNLDVGYIYDTEGEENRFTPITLTSTPTYGIQNSKARGLVSGERYYYGVVEFSEPLKINNAPTAGNSYWYPKENSSCYNETYKSCINGLVANVVYTDSYSPFKINTTGDNNEIVDSIKLCKDYTQKDKTCSEDPDTGEKIPCKYKCDEYKPNPNFCYVYQSFECEKQKHNNVYDYVNKYGNYLKENLKINSATATIMSFEQAWSLATMQSNAGVLDWLNNTTFWLGTAFNDTDMLIRTSSGSFGWDGGANLDYEDNVKFSAINAGVRPVITVSKEDIAEK